ncbi:MAG TPA: VOC family protein [Paracoccaceae bacterium]|nr:VOC family protein [Paracoccaceae bacterium]
MEQRVTLITLGVADVARAAAFYEALGWKRAAESQEGIAFFQLAGQALALYPRVNMAEDMGCPVEGAGSIALAQNLPTREEVDRAYEEAVSAGGKPLRTPYETPWGGYIAYVADPDGHPWEFAHVPAFPLSPDGTLTLPSAAASAG